MKLNAAKFLLDNIPGQLSLQPESVAGNKYFIDRLQELAETYANDLEYIKRENKTKAPDEAFYRTMDSILKVKKGVKLKSKRVPDSTTISSKFIIQNIEDSFWAWRNLPWAKDVSYEIFKEFVLIKLLTIIGKEQDRCFYKNIEVWWTQRLTFRFGKHRRLSEKIYISGTKKMVSPSNTDIQINVGDWEYILLTAKDFLPKALKNEGDFQKGMA